MLVAQAASEPVLAQVAPVVSVVPYLVGQGVRALPWRALAPLAQPVVGYTTAG